MTRLTARERYAVEASVEEALWRQLQWLRQVRADYLEKQSRLRRERIEARAREERMGV